MLEHYLTKRPRSRYWQLRLPVPVDVQGPFGRKVVTMSLREEDERRAAIKAMAHINELNTEWDRLRSSRALPPSEETLLALTRQIYERALNITAEKRSSQAVQEVESYNDYVSNQEDAHVLLVREISRNNLARWEDSAEQILTKRGYVVDRSDPTFRKFTTMVAHATVSAIEVANRQDRGDLGAKPSSLVLERAQTAMVGGHKPAQDLSFSALVDAYMTDWLANRSNDKGTNTEQQKRATYRLFSGYWTDKPIRSVAEADASFFRDQLKRFHKNWGKSPVSGQMTWSELQNKFGDQPRGLSASTMNRHMAALQKLWWWAKKRGHCEGENPFSGHQVRIQLGRNSHSYLPWEADELAKLFSPPPPRVDLHEVMTVALYTGMRLNEIASLEWHHVKTALVDDGEITYFMIDLSLIHI